MMGEKNVGDSDSNDSDFKISSENLSNEFSTSESESTTSESNGFPTSSKKTKIKMKKTEKKKKCLPKENEICIPVIKNRSTDFEVTPEKEKEQTDLLWKNFLKSTGTQSKTYEKNSLESVTNSQILQETIPKGDSNLEIKKDHHLNFTKASKCKQIKTSAFNNAHQQNDLKRRGLSNILSGISKRSKLNTLEKSKQDWNQFKEEHNLNEEITNFNRGKNGYLERQDFLQRTDSRQFEIEKELRNSGRRKTR